MRKVLARYTVENQKDFEQMRQNLEEMFGDQPNLKLVFDARKLTAKIILKNGNNRSTDKSTQTSGV